LKSLYATMYLRSKEEKSNCPIAKEWLNCM
jgi:hypothetical protein